MLGVGGKFAASKGMVLVPDLSGKTVSEANQALSAAGLVVGTTSSTVRNDSPSLDNKAYSQSIAAGTSVDYETVINFSYWTYVYVPPAAPPVTYSPCGSCGEQIDQIDQASGCSGTSYWESFTAVNKQPYCRDDNGQFAFYSECGREPYYSSSVVPGLCGAPTCSGSYKDNVGFPGSCSGGQKCTYYNWYDSCGNYLKTTEGGCTSCCTAGLVSCSTVTVASGVYVKTCTYRRADCSTYTDSTTTCSTTSSTSCGSCVYAGYTIGSYKSCTTTTRSSSCTTSTSTKSVKC